MKSIFFAASLLTLSSPAFADGMLTTDADPIRSAVVGAGELGGSAYLMNKIGPQVMEGFDEIKKEELKQGDLQKMLARQKSDISIVKLHAFLDEQADIKQARAAGDKDLEQKLILAAEKRWAANGNEARYKDILKLRNSTIPELEERLAKTTETLSTLRRANTIKKGIGAVGVMALGYGLYDQLSSMHYTESAPQVNSKGFSVKVAPAHSEIAHPEPASGGNDGSEPSGPAVGAEAR